MAASSSELLKVWNSDQPILIEPLMPTEDVCGGLQPFHRAGHLWGSGIRPLLIQLVSILACRILVQGIYEPRIRTLCSTYLHCQVLCTLPSTTLGTPAGIDNYLILSNPVKCMFCFNLGFYVSFKTCLDSAARDGIP